MMRQAALFGAIAAAMATLPGLGAGTLWDNSETAYGEVAREILLLGDPVVMHLNAAPWFVQPPLYFWVAAFLAKFLGIGAFAMRLPSALATIGMGAAVAACVERLAGLRAAAFAAVILAGALMQAALGRLAIMDAMLDLMVALSILAAFAALRSGSERLWYGAFIAAAFGVLAKGPVAVVIPLLVVGVWAVWERRSGGAVVAPKPRVLLMGTLLFSSIAVPWFVLVVREAGPRALNELLGHYTLGRYLGTIESQSGPVWYYVPVVILGFFPWIAFLVPALACAWRSGRALERLCLAWSAVPFVFFSFAQTKLPNYIALELPALAILVALWLDAGIDRDARRGVLPWAALIPFAMCAVGAAIGVFAHVNRLDGDVQSIVGDLKWTGLVMFAGSAACFALLWTERLAVFAPFALALSSLGAILAIAFVVEPHAERFKPIPTLAERIQGERGKDDAVAIWGVAGANALVFYTQPPVEEMTPPFEERSVREAVCTAKRLFLVTSRARAASISGYHRKRSELAAAGRDILLLYDGPKC